jgi:hypothetical protein
VRAGQRTASVGIQLTARAVKNLVYGLAGLLRRFGLRRRLEAIAFHDAQVSRTEPFPPLVGQANDGVFHVESPNLDCMDFEIENVPI